MLKKWDRMQGWRIREDLEVSATGNRCDLCFGGKNGDEMGRNSVSAFICNIGAWGYMGRNRLSPLEMGSKGGGRYPNIPKAKEIGRRVDGKTQPELGMERSEEKQGRNTPHGGCATWFAQARVLVSTGVVPECSTAQLDIGEPLMIATWLLHNLNRKSRSTGLTDTLHDTPFVLR
jgi:hypothetical protein